MKLRFLIIGIIMLFISQADVYSQAAKKVYLFKIEEEIAPPAWRKTEKAFKEAQDINADIIVLKLNTFGGTLDDADKIRTQILESRIPVYVFIDNNAASAGALISIACDSIYMRQGANIGAATVVDQKGEVLPDKYQSYMRSLMRSTAEATGRDPIIAEAMVDPSIQTNNIIDSGKVLTLTAQEAINNGFCQAVANNVHEVLKHAGVEKYEIKEQRISALDRVINFLVNPFVSGILIMIIIGGIYFELQSPGIGFPLIAAITAALLYFAPLYLEGLAASWEILLFIAGVVLLVLEIFVIPGFGVAGISGIICIVTGLAFSLIGNVGFDFSHVPTIHILTPFTVVIAAILIALPASFLLGKKFFTETRMGGRLTLETEQKAEEGYSIADHNLQKMIGKTGVALSILRPSGKIEIENEVYDAVAFNSFIEKGEKVEVINYETISLVVKKIVD